MTSSLERTFKADIEQITEELGTTKDKVICLTEELNIVKAELQGQQDSHQNDMKMAGIHTASRISDMLHEAGNDVDESSEVARVLLLMFASRIRRGAYNE